MKRFTHWKAIAIIAIFTLLAVLQPVATYACGSHGGC